MSGTPDQRLPLMWRVLRKLRAAAIRRIAPAGTAVRQPVISTNFRRSDGAQTFNDLPVTPGFIFNRNPQKCAGGPIWPDFARQRAIRHHHTNKLADVEPPMPEGPLARLKGEYVWMCRCGDGPT
jgi:hypothetical protein